MSGLTRPDQWLEAGISPEARGVINEASGAMNDWINKSVADLSSKITTEIDNAGQELAAQVAQVSQQLAAANGDLQKQINALDDYLATAAGDPKLQDAIKLTKSKIQGVQDYLQQREQQWKNTGSTIVSMAVGAAKKIATA
jgi:hypothetical protein